MICRDRSRPVPSVRIKKAWENPGGKLAGQGKEGMGWGLLVIVGRRSAAEDRDCSQSEDGAEKCANHQPTVDYDRHHSFHNSPLSLPLMWRLQRNTVGEK